jgi:hypothetical protein
VTPNRTASSAAAAVASAAATSKALPSLSPPGSLTSSKLYFLTKLPEAQLCGLLHDGEPSSILGAATSPPVYEDFASLGNICTWTRAGAGSLSQDQLYIGVSPALDWQGVQRLDAPYHVSATTIDGHPALAAGPGANIGWAQLDVATGGAHDPVVEFRGPSMGIATSLATLVTPRVLGLTP